MEIVSFANPISCQLNPALWNILKFTQSAGGGRGGGRGRWTKKSVEVKKKEKKRKSAAEETEKSGNRVRESGGREMEIGHH